MKYIGVKEVSAVPMSYNEAIEKGYRVSDTVATEGYEVEYEGGYKSWSPKDVFEKAYIESEMVSIRGRHVDMQPHEERVSNEYFELLSKHSALVSFIRGDVFKTVDEDEQERLKFQATVMAAYINILAKRIINFKSRV